jgi:putative PLP-dependent aminotransferase (TIGR04422 family)
VHTEIFLWPSCKLSLSEILSSSRSSVEEIEQWFCNRYPGSYPVVTSSGRSAIVLSLQALDLQRPDWISIAPYSSACIFRSVGECATPVPGCVEGEFSGELLYHQWGFVHTSRLVPIRVEDSVDSLIVNEAALFASGGQFEIVSLSKLLGAPMGAVVFCRDSLLQAKIREKREAAKYLKWSQTLLCMLAARNRWAATTWHHTESGNAALIDLFCGAIYRKLSRFDDLIAERQRKLSLVRSVVPDWLPISSSRLPCSVPVEIQTQALPKLAALGLNSGMRHFNASLNQADWQLRKVFPLPIHHEMPMHILRRALDIVQRHKI